MPGLCEHAEKTQGIVRKSRQVLDFGLVTRHEVAESEMDIECGKQEISVSSEKMTNIPYLNCVPIDDRKECEKGMGKYNEIYLRPAAMNMVEEDGKIWMVLLNRNGICEIDKATRKARICKVFEDEPLERETLYCHVEKVEHYLIFSPSEAEKIAIYDLNQNSMNYIQIKKLDRHYKQSQNEAKFWNIIRDHSDVYLLGYSYPAIVKINLETMKVTYITEWVKEVEEYIEDGDSRGYFGDGYVIIDDSVLIPLGCMNAILELNLRKCLTRLKKINVSMKGIGGLSSADGENIWLVGKSSRTNLVACWNVKTDRVKEYEVPDMEENILDPFYAPICAQKKIFFMPMSAPFIYEIDNDSNNVKKSSALERKFGDRAGALWPWWRIMAPRIEGDWLRYITCDDLGWHEYNVTTGERRECYIYIEESAGENKLYFDSLYSNYRERRQLIFERKIPLRYLIEREIETDNQYLCEKDRKFFSGKKLYDRVRVSI